MNFHSDSIFRYRSLGNSGLCDKLFLREIDALDQAYLYASDFYSQNDPMEAFINPDEFLSQILGLPNAISLEKNFKNTIKNFGLVSFTKNRLNNCMWAYYGNCFKGICLEFDKNVLKKGQLKNEHFYDVVYSNNPPARIPIYDIAGACIAALTQKTKDWGHEEEIRVLTGSTGRRAYPDIALKSIIFGPKIEKNHADRIIEIFQNRPTTIYQSNILNYEMRYKLIKKAKKVGLCERVGRGILDFDAIDAEEIKKLSVLKYKKFCEYIRLLKDDPNFDILGSCGASTDNPGQVYIWETYKFRNGNKEPIEIQLKKTF